MGQSSTQVQVGNNSFDIVEVGNWVTNNVWVFLLVAFVVFMFHVFQKGGFAEKLLDYRIRKKELDAKQVEDVRILIDISKRKYDREDPLLPFDDPNLGEPK